MAEPLTKQVLKLLADLRPRTTKEIAKELGCTTKEVHGVLNKIRTYGWIESEPVCYFITPVGSTVAARPPKERKTSPLALERRRARYAELHADTRPGKPGPKPRVRVDQPAANDATQATSLKVGS